MVVPIILNEDNNHKGNLDERDKCENKGIWKMIFDGACSRMGSSAGIDFTSRKGDKLRYAYRLDSNSNNNVVEYEALILGLDLAIEMGIRVLKVIDDFDFMVQQVTYCFGAKNERLRCYTHDV